MKEPGKLEVVYYSSPIPENLSFLTFLGLVFDRVHFPNVYIPNEGFDKDEVVAEVKRLDSLGRTDRSTIILTQLAQAALIPELNEFCFFTGTEDQKVFGGDLTKASELVEALHIQMHGPFPENFEPSWIPGYSKGLSYEASIDYPADFYYQCNALVYSAENNLPLINAMPNMPVPPITGVSAKNNTSFLSAIMAMECVNLVLPEIGELQPQQIVELRNELADEFAAFRQGLLRLARDLNSTIDKTSDELEILSAAKFIVETEVHPNLLELKAALSKPQIGGLRRAFNFTKKVPSLVAAYTSLGATAAAPALVSALAELLISSQKQKSRSNMYYLLKLEDRV
ncbi:MAG: hypothetical protein COA96_13315 [SAR86 cluster bacterium]|uniref:Uncharacterized protein n=1 Tax=SAR86 cluster bacterium TaxID=2030880 RepID=A0A2A5AU07_9GAMM|nr:MAG: hypothetical protein COA96_13315 [SAR86 cluster bacterium]